MWGTDIDVKELIEELEATRSELDKLQRINEINEAIIELLKDKTSIQEDIIRSFESGEMIMGGTYENKTGTHGKHCRECGRDECSLWRHDG